MAIQSDIEALLSRVEFPSLELFILFAGGFIFTTMGILEFLSISSSSLTVGIVVVMFIFWASVSGYLYANFD